MPGLKLLREMIILRGAAKLPSKARLVEGREGRVGSPITQFSFVANYLLMEKIANYTAYKMTRHQAVAYIFTIAMLCFYTLSQEGTKSYETNMHAICRCILCSISFALLTSPKILEGQDQETLARCLPVCHNLMFQLRLPNSQQHFR